MLNTHYKFPYVKLTAAETISGTRFVTMNTSGDAVVAMAGNTGRMPAIGLADANYASGTIVTVWNGGKHVQTSISGALPGSVYVGCSGSPQISSGGLLSGNAQQVVGYATASGVVLNQI